MCDCLQKVFAFDKSGVFPCNNQPVLGKPPFDEQLEGMQQPQQVFVRLYIAYIEKRFGPLTVLMFENIGIHPIVNDMKLFRFCPGVSQYLPM